MYSFVSGFFHPTMVLRSIKVNVYIRSSFIFTASSAPLFVYALVDLLIDIWAVFQFWAVMNKAAMNKAAMNPSIVCGHMFSFRGVTYSGTGLLCHWMDLCLTFCKISQKTSNMLVQLYTILAIYERPS